MVAALDDEAAAIEDRSLFDNRNPTANGDRNLIEKDTADEVQAALGAQITKEDVA